VCLFVGGSYRRHDGHLPALRRYAPPYKPA
jgi:hypothetical protein